MPTVLNLSRTCIMLPWFTQDTSLRILFTSHTTFSSLSTQPWVSRVQLMRSKSLRKICWHWIHQLKKKKSRLKLQNLTKSSTSTANNNKLPNKVLQKVPRNKPNNKLKKKLNKTNQPRNKAKVANKAPNSYNCEMFVYFWRICQMLLFNYGHR